MLGIGTKCTKATLMATTKIDQDPPSCHLVVDNFSDYMYNLKRLRGRFVTDTFHVNMKYLHENICFQLYSHKIGFPDFYPRINTKGDSLGETLNDFVHYFGVPEHLTFDGFQYQSWGK